MAGHSKWANIKHKKAKTDAQKGALFTKYSREIIVSVKMGGADPEGNFRLRTAIAAAKAAGLPNDNIKRAIEKGQGTGAGDNLESIVYEGYGPGGVAVIAETFTDNRNRTAGDIRSYFNKNQGNLGETNCVSWMFDTVGIILLEKANFEEDHVLDVALNAGADDFAYDKEENLFKITTSSDSLQAVAEEMEANKLQIRSASIERIPKNTIEIVDPEVAKYLIRLLDSIENHDDVQKVYANFEMSDSLFESLS